MGLRADDKNELKKRAVELRLTGATFEEIREELGVCNETIRKWVRHLNPKKESINKETEQAIIRLYHKGWNVNDIAEKFKIKSVSTVYYVCKKYSWECCRSNIPRGWVLNHPFQFELEADERKRYLEVVERRRLAHPEAGYDYASRT